MGWSVVEDAGRGWRRVVASPMPKEVVSCFAGKPGNCGVLVHSSKPRALYGMFPQSIECQMQSGEAGDFWCIEEDIAVVWVIMNNHAFGTIAGLEAAHYGTTFATVFEIVPYFRTLVWSNASRRSSSVVWTMIS